MALRALALIPDVLVFSVSFLATSSSSLTFSSILWEGESFECRIQKVSLLISRYLPGKIRKDGVSMYAKRQDLRTDMHS